MVHFLMGYHAVSNVSLCFLQLVKERTFYICIVLDSFVGRFAILSVVYEVKVESDTLYFVYTCLV